jgi:hypothetical protein
MIYIVWLRYGCFWSFVFLIFNYLFSMQNYLSRHFYVIIQCIKILRNESYIKSLILFSPYCVVYFSSQHYCLSIVVVFIFHKVYFFILFKSYRYWKLFEWLHRLFSRLQIKKLVIFFLCLFFGNSFYVYIIFHETLQRSYICKTHLGSKFLYKIPCIYICVVAAYFLFKSAY